MMPRLISYLRQHKAGAAACLFLLLAALFLNKALLPPPGQALGGYDMRGYYAIVHQVVREALRSGHLPLWDPYRYAGFPLLADPQQNTFYPLAWLMLVLPVNVAISWYMLFHIWLAGVGMAAFVRFMGGRWTPALLAGIAFAFSGLLAGRLWAGHSTVYAVDAWAPWLLLALAWSVRRGSTPAAVLAGLPFGLSILAGHFPSFLYLGLLWAAFAGYLLLEAGSARLRVVRQATVMALVGLGLAAVQLVPFIQFSLFSQRVAAADFAFASEYSLPPAHLITLIVPEFFGEPTRTGYWSVPTFEELTYYAGLVSLLGLILGLCRPTRLTWFYILLMVGGLWLALGRYGVLYQIAYTLLPPFRIVRAPARAAFIYLVAATALLGHALTVWLSIPLSERRETLGRLLRWTLALAAVCGVAALAATGAVFMAIHPTDTSGRLWHQLGGYTIALVVLLLGGGLIWGYLTARPQEVRRRTLLAAGLVVLTVADLWLFAFKMVRLEPVGPDPFWLEARELLGDTRARVLPWGLPVFSQNQAVPVQLHSVFGYNALEPEAHIALVTSVPDPRSSAYDVLGVAYVLAPVPLDQFTGGERPLALLAQQGGAWIYERDRVLPVARLVHAAEIIPDGAAAIARIHAPDFDPTTTVILAAPPPCDLRIVPAAPAEAEVVAMTSGYWRISTRSDAPALLVLAETAYPGWQVTVDGRPVEWQTAYTTIRAVCVPAGEHVVEWRFRPTIYWAGGLLTLLSLALVGMAAVVMRRRA